jgi:pimeloyl-ACP methyl ester carboxylesterase
MTDYVELLQKGDTTALAAHLKTLNAIGSRMRHLPDAVDQYVDARLREYVQGPGLTRLPRLAVPRPLDSLSTLTLPTLLLVGGQDHTYIQDNASYLKKHLPNSSLHTIQKTGHLPNMEQPRRYNRLLYRFLKDGNE